MIKFQTGTNWKLTKYKHLKLSQQSFLHIILLFFYFFCTKTIFKPVPSTFYYHNLSGTIFFWTFCYFTIPLLSFLHLFKPVPSIFNYHRFFVWHIDTNLTLNNYHNCQTWSLHFSIFATCSIILFLSKTIL